MVKYSRDPKDEAVAAKARGSDLRTHFKKAREVGHALRGMKVEAAQEFLQNVLDKKEGVPFKRFTGGCGRHAQGKQKNISGSHVGWPTKSTKYFMDLLTNVMANAKAKDLDLDELVVRHVQVNRAAKMRRRTYRAHGRIGPYMCNPCHIELWVSKQDQPVAKAKPGKNGGALKLSNKGLAIRRRHGRVPIGGGAA